MECKERWIREITCECAWLMEYFMRNLNLYCPFPNRNPQSESVRQSVLSSSDIHSQCRYTEWTRNWTEHWTGWKTGNYILRIHFEFELSNLLIQFDCLSCSEFCPVPSWSIPLPWDYKCCNRRCQITPLKFRIYSATWTGHCMATIRRSQAKKLLPNENTAKFGEELGNIKV